jgi:uncharacterized repeat protein (TIGR01451 family)
VQYLLTDEQGGQWSLELGEETARAAGGVLELNRKRVEVVGDRIADRGVNTLRVRSIALAAGAASGGASASPPMASPGSVAWATLPCRFADSPGVSPRNLAYFQGLMGTAEPGLDHYWRELSYNNVDLTGSDEFDWQNLANNRSYYFDASGNALLALLAQECVDAHDAGVDFTNFQGMNLMFNQDLDCCAWGGSSTVDTDETGLKSLSTTWMPPWGFNHQGTLGHETGHGFGLPHSGGPYTTAYDSQWDVMSASKGACINPDPTYGCVGVHTISYHLDLLGAMPPARKYTADASKNQFVTLERLALPGPTGYLMAVIPVGAPGLDFYTVEARKFAGYDSRLPGEAVIMHAVDVDRPHGLMEPGPANVVDPDNNSNPNDAAAMWLPGELFEDTANGISMAVVKETTSGFVIAINPTADVAIEKTDRPDPVMAGDQLYYYITVANHGPGPAVGLVVMDTLPAGVTFITDDLGICAEGPVGTLTCDVGALVGGDSMTIAIKVKVDPDLVDIAGRPTSICNDVEVTHDVPDTDLGNNSATECTIVEELADLRITKVNKPDDAVNAGETITYEILVDNFGPSVARNAQLTDLILSNGSFTITEVTTSQGTCAPPPPPLPVTATGSAIVTCDLGDLDPGSTSVSGRATVTVEVKANEAQDINNIADVTSDTPDPDLSNNQAEASVSVTAVADLAITKSDSPDPVVAGETLTYTIQVTNNGPSTAVNVVVEDVLPAGVSIDSVSASSGECNAGVPGDPFLPTTCTFDSLVPGASRIMTIGVTVLPDTLGLLRNDARASSDTVDVDNSDNLATATTTVDTEADISVSKTAQPSPSVVAGESLTYIVAVSNNGPSVARDVQMTDTLPNLVTFTGATIFGPGTCALVSQPPNTVSCQFGDLDPGASITVNIDVVVSPSAPDGSIINTATASSSTADLGPGPNTDGEDTTVDAVADLAITKTTDRNLFKPSTTVKYTITVTNNGPSDAQGVVVVDTLPDKKTGYWVFDTGYLYDPDGCLLSGVTLRCEFGTLAAGASIAFDIYFHVIGNKGAVTNTAEVSQDVSVTDPDTSNNTAVRTNLVQGKNTGKR